VLHKALRHGDVLEEFEVQLYAFFYLGTRWRWMVSFTGRFTPRERAPGTHWIGGWVGPKAGQDLVSKRKTPSP